MFEQIADEFGKDEHYVEWLAKQPAEMQERLRKNPWLAASRLSIQVDDMLHTLASSIVSATACDMVKIGPDDRIVFRMPVLLTTRQAAQIRTRLEQMLGGDADRIVMVGRDITFERVSDNG